MTPTIDQRPRAPARRTGFLPFPTNGFDRGFISVV